MATDVDRAYSDWSQEECDGDEHQETSVSQVLEHGSISFGRFASETLSWERRSVFTHNRRQEELDQFNGLVAKKKAYFEERYRRLRALKASQQSQQTELLLDYDGEGSNSSQSGEEDEKITEHESVKVEVENGVHVIFGEHKTDPLFDQTSCNEALQIDGFHPVSTFLDVTSSEGSLIHIVQDTKNIDRVQSQPLVIESSSAGENIEENEVKQSSSLGSKEIAGEPEILESSVNIKASTHESMVKTKSSKVSQLQSFKTIQGYKSVLKAKDNASGIIRSRTLKQQTRSDVVQPSKGVKDASKRIVGKAESNYLSRKTTTSRVNINTRSTMVGSNKPLAETQPKINTPGPFTFVMERRASSRGKEVNLDSRPPNKSALLHAHANGGSSVQDMPRKTAVTTAVKNTRGSGQDAVRALNEARNKNLLSDNRTSLKRIPLLTSKSRSLDLPARSKYGSNKTEIQPIFIKENNQKKLKEDMRTPGIRTRTTISSMAEAAERRKITAKAQQIQNSEQTGRRDKRNNLSHDGKPRQEIPKWR